jgi:hypothetical protein
MVSDTSLMHDEVQLRIIQLDLMQCFRLIISKVSQSIFNVFLFPNTTYSRSQWPRGLRRRSAAARLLRSWVWIPPEGMDVGLLWVLCFVRQWSLRRADHSSGGVLPTVVRRCVWCRKPQEWGGHDPRWVAAPQKKKTTYFQIYWVV